MAKREQAMTRMEFRAILKDLGMTPYAVAKHIGVSTRHAHRYANGDTEIPGPVALVMRSLPSRAKRRA
jgi:plasmid maintenance system antidote protein VapI